MTKPRNRTMWDVRDMDGELWEVMATGPERAAEIAVGLMDEGDARLACSGAVVTVGVRRAAQDGLAEGAWLDYRVQCDWAATYHVIGG